jgi:molybdate transport system regulatory protein
MQPHYNLWLEKDGEVVLSLWRVRLLQAVADTGSITAAAESLGVPYRVAWQKIHEMEERLGEKLVTTQVGGAHGGGARLTPAADAYLDRFERFAHDLERFVTDSFEANFLRPNPWIPQDL